MSDSKSSDRREFLSTALAASCAAAAGALPLRAQEAISQSASLKKPIAWKLLQSDTKETGDNTETTAGIELTGSDGAKHHYDVYTKRIKRQGGHDDTVIMHLKEFDASGNLAREDSQTIVASTEYGPVEGEIRRDKVRLKIFNEKGESRSSAATVKVPLSNLYSGLSDQELTDKILS